MGREDLDRARARLKRRSHEEQLLDEETQEGMREDREEQEEKRQKLRELGSGAAFARSVGSGAMNLFHGLEKFITPPGTTRDLLSERQEEHRADVMEPLREGHPKAAMAGEIVGEGLATMPLGGLAALPKTASIRRTGLGILGMLEGAALSEDELEGAGVGGTVAVAMDVLLPKVGRTIRKFVQRITGKKLKGSGFTADGDMTEELASTLESNKIDPETFVKNLQERLASDASPHLDPTAQARAARAESFGSQLTSGQAAKDFAAQEAESVVLGSSTPAGDMARQAQKAAQEGIQKGAKVKLLDPFRSSLDLDFTERSSRFTRDEVGKYVKDAVEEISTRDKRVIDDLYDAARAIPGAADPIPSRNMVDIMEQMVDERVVDDQVVSKLQRALAKYGVIGTNPVKKGSKTVVDFNGQKIEFLGGVEDLSVNTANDLRKRINVVSKADQSGLTTAVKSQLDKNIGEFIETAGGEGTEKIAAFRKANEAFGAFKDEFEAGDIIQELMATKRGTSTPSVGEEQVLDKIIRGKRKRETIIRLRHTLLGKDGKGGTAKSRQAWKDVGAVTIEDMLKQSVEKGSVESGGAVLSGARFNSQIEKIGDEALKALLPVEQFKRVKAFQAALSDLTIPLPRTQNRSESGQRVLNMIFRLMDTKAPGMGQVIKRTAENKAGKKALEKGLRSVEGMSPTKARLRKSTAAAQALMDFAGVSATVKAGEE